MQRENKETKIEAFPHMPLKPEAFQRPIEVKDDINERDRLLHSIYEEKPEYDFNDRYKTQIKKLCDRLYNLAKDYKITVENLSEITAFPEHLFHLISNNLNTTPYGNIKQSLEKLVYLLQKKIIVSKENILARYKEKKIELNENELHAQLELEKQDAASVELRKQMVLEMLLPYLRMCDTGIAGHLDFAVQTLSGGDTLQDAWCEQRTKLVTDFGFEHLRQFREQISEGADIHVPVVLRNYALQKNWGINSSMGNVTDHFAKLTLITPVIEHQFADQFSNDYDIRVMTDIFAKKFEEAFWKNYRIKVSGREAKSFTGWLPYKAEIIYCAEDILKKWGLDIPAGNLFEKNEDGSELRISTPLLKQIFWQYCQRGNHYVERDNWKEEKVFDNYRLFHPKSAAFTDLAWIEDTEGNIVSFEKLPPEEQMRYFIYSTINFGVPDRFNWQQPSPNFFSTITHEKDLQQFAKALQEQNKFIRHEELLKTLLKEYPHRLVTILMSVPRDKAMKILDTVEIDYQWMHTKDFPWQLIRREDSEEYDKEDPLSWNAVNRDPELAGLIQQRLNHCRARFEKFQHENKLEPGTIPIPYSTLLKRAKNATADDQYIFKLYFQHYFPTAFRKMSRMEKPDYAQAFEQEHLKSIGDLNKAQQQLNLYVLDGNLKALQEYKLSFHEITVPFVQAAHVLQHTHLLEYFYDLAEKELNHLSLTVRFDQVAQRDVLLAVKDIDVNEVNSFGNTALHFAARYKLTDSIKLLLAARANIDATNIDDETPLSMAAQMGSLNAVRLLLENKADINKERNDGLTPIVYAAHFGHVEIVRELLEKKAQVNLPANLESPILHSVERNFEDITQLLIDYHANVNTITLKGRTALSFAVENGHIEMVKLLLRAGANCLLIGDKKPLAFAKNPFIKQLLLAAEFKNEANEIKNVFANYRVMQPTPPLFRDNAWVGWIENNAGEVVSFDDLPPTEKMRYFTYSMVNFTFPDHFKLATPSANFLNIFKDDNSLQDLARELERENHFEKHMALFVTLFRHYTDRFITMLQAMRPESVLKILDGVDIDFHWLHPTSNYFDASWEVLDKLKPVVLPRFQFAREQFQTFQRENKLDMSVSPISYAKLVEHADQAKPSEQFVYKLYVQHYFPQIIVDAKTNYAKVFKIEHEKEMKKVRLPRAQLIETHVRDGNLKALQEMKVTLNEAKMVHYPEGFLHPDILKYFYSIAEAQQSEILYWSVYFKQADKVKALLERKDISINHITRDFAPLYVADYQIATSLITQLANINFVDSEVKITPLMVATSNNRVDVVRLFLLNRADVNLSASNSMTALSYAAHHGHFSIATMLIARGANVNAAINTEQHPLSLAIKNNHFNMARLLLENKADVNSGSPLILAIQENYIECALLLIQFGANLDGALYQAIAFDNFNAFNMLLEHKAKVNDAGKDGITPLHLAAKLGKLDIVKYLLQARADTTLQANGKTPAQLAKDPMLIKILSPLEDKHREEKRIFENFKFYLRSEEKNDTAWIENKSGKIIPFQELPPAEKMRYFIYSTVHFDFPDRYHLLQSAPTVLDIFKDENDLIALAKNFEMQNKFEWHESFFKTFFRNDPQRLMIMLSAMSQESAAKVLDLIDFNYHFLHPTSDVHLQAQALRPFLEKNPPILHNLNKLAIKMKNFQSANKLKMVNPIPYSALVANAKKLQPENQEIYRLYLKHYFPVEFTQECSEAKPDFIRAFDAAHHGFIKKFSNPDYIIPLCDGDLKKIVDLKLSLEDFISIRHKLGNKFNHQHIYDYFFKMAKSLFDQGKSPWDASLLYWAACLNQKAILPSLLEVKDANVNLPYKDGGTALIDSAWNNLIDIQKMLLEKGDGRSVINVAAGLGNIELLRLLIERKTDVNTALITYMRPLISAACYGHLATVQLLINAKADINAADKVGDTALSLAIKYGHTAIVKCLLNAGADYSNISRSNVSSPHIKQLLLAEALKKELKKLLEFKTDADRNRFFEDKAKQPIVECGHKLLFFLEGNNLARDLAEEKAVFSQYLTTEPWVSFYNEALNLGTAIEKLRAERR